MHSALTAQISNLCFAVAGAFMVERMGRRPLWFISTGGMLVCLIIVTALSATFIKDSSAAIGGAVVAFLYLFYGVSLVSCGCSCHLNTVDV